jgi:ElaB/YqjD/DUF883 family membrane-anchored ribosome-binding protein
MKSHSHDSHSHENSVASRISDETKALIEATATATEDTVVAARNRLKAAMDATGEVYTRVRDQAVAGAKKTDKMIRANPYQSLGIAFGVGALVGYLWSRRSRD